MFLCAKRRFSHSLYHPCLEASPLLLRFKPPAYGRVDIKDDSDECYEPLTTEQFSGCATYVSAPR